MEKIKIGKHDHKLTNLLKFFIFSIIMIAPFLSVLATCLYVANNKNAKESYYGETINEEQIITPTNFNTNQEYLLYWSNLTTYTQSPAPRIYLTNFEIVEKGTMNDTTYNTILAFGNNIDYITITNYNGNPNIQFGGENVTSVNLTSQAWVFSFNYISSTNGFLVSELRYIEYNKYSFLDNVFYYSVNQIPNQQLFAWTKNTAIYTPIYNMCMGLGWDANNNVLAVLLTYWSLNIAIYIVFDIIIFTFTKLTHFLNN